LQLLNTSRIWVGVLGLVVVVLAGLIARDVFVPATPTASSVRTALVTVGSVRSSVSGTGSVEPAAQMNVGFKTGGQLVEVDVKAGDHVSAGQVLGRIDSTSAQMALEQAQAALQSAQSRLQADYAPASPDQIAQLRHQVSAAQTNYNDTVTQVNFTNQQDANTVSADENQYNVDQCNIASNARDAACTADVAKIQQDQSKQQQDQISGQKQIDQASQSITQAQDALNSATEAKPNAISSDQASIASAQAQVDSAQSNLDATTLHSPMSGYVVSVNGQPGESAGSGGGATTTAPGSTAPQPAASSTSGSSGSAAFVVLSSDSGYEAVVPFAETDAARLQANQPATATFDAVNGLSLSAHVLAVSVNATVISNVVNYYATFTFDSSDPRLKAGMTANLTVVVAESDNVLVVPNSAITRRGQAATVTVLQNDGTRVITPVETGVQGDSATEVTNGLKQGDRVLLPSLTGSGAGTRGGGGVVFGGGGGRGPGGGG
jgi:multidrug efflux pump subunit AcrA (membrane-fusion protein)